MQLAGAPELAEPKFVKSLHSPDRSGDQSRLSSPGKSPTHQLARHLAGFREGRGLSGRIHFN
jgi:hypothetical protein